jgi:hypothetical protein
MMLRTGMAVVAAGLLFLSGCTSDSDQPSATPTSAAAPAAGSGSPALAALMAAAAKTRSGSYHDDVTMKSDSTNLAISADVDPQAKALQLTMNSQGVAMTVRRIGTDMYFTGLGTDTLKGKWVRADVSRLPGVEGILDTFEQNIALIGGVVDVAEGPPGTFTGSVDPKAALAKADTDATREALSKIISAGSADRLPFTAKVVDGYLVETSTAYKVEQNATVQDATIVSKMSNFGKVAPILAPSPADVITAS